MSVLSYTSNDSINTQQIAEYVYEVGIMNPDNSRVVTINKPKWTKLNTYQAAFTIKCANPDDDKMRELPAKFLFTSDERGETMSILVGGAVFNFSFDPVQMLLNMTRDARKDIS